MEKFVAITKEINILSLEDSPYDFKIIFELLSSAGIGFHMNRVENEQDFISALKNEKYDIILADFNLPQYNAFEALQKANEICPDIPFICVSGSIGEETAIELIKNGAVDYVLKDKPEKLPYAVRRALHEAQEKTTLQRIEDDLRKSEERFRHVSESSGEWIWEVDQNGVYTYTSSLSQSLLGYQPEEILGKKYFYDFFAPDVRENLKELAFQSFAKGVPFCNFENPNLHKDGHVVMLETSGFPIFDDHGNLTGYRGADKDISERKKAELALIEAKERAEESNQLKMALLSNMNHEIRTPMNAILGFSNMMSEVKGDEKDEFAAIIFNNSNQLLTLIDDVIFVSRLQSEKITPQIGDYSPAGLISEVSRLFDTPYLKRELDIFVTIPAEFQNLYARSDAMSVRRILTNLLSNALKYTLEGSIELGVKWSGDKIEFFVKDTGVGISVPEQKHIFETFYRSRFAIDQAIRGNGLGLSICKELVRSLGGEIGFTSESNVGSRFYFAIPFEPAVQMAMEDRMQGAVRKELKDFSILIADDERINYQYLEILLKGIVSNTDHAINGKVAVELASKNHYDLILMDIKMPVMGGMEATKLLKISNPQLPVIAQTAYTSPEDRLQAMQAGCDEFISKPIKKSDLIEMIKRFAS